MTLWDAGLYDALAKPVFNWAAGNETIVFAGLDGREKSRTGLFGEDAFELSASSSCVTSASVQMCRSLRGGGKSGLVVDSFWGCEFNVLEWRGKVKIDGEFGGESRVGCTWVEKSGPGPEGRRKMEVK